MNDAQLQSKSGHASHPVALVGAGPGDPGLLTLRGRELLELADVVLADALVNPRMRSFAPKADWIDVGKRGGRASTPQDDITELMIEHARAGKRVVRLKGGDPFVFGRGGEECVALAAAGIAFEVVPGITAAVAAAAYAGIPVTHRDFNSSFTLITGHAGTDPSHAGLHADEAKSSIDWSAVARLPCIAFYMAVANLPEICARLIEQGMSPDTPAATIERGTTPRQRTIVSTLQDLPAAAADAKIEAPAVTIIGKVVELRNTMRWFDTRPLFGKTVVVTRTRQQASELSAKLEHLGANVIEAPTLELVPPGDWAEVDALFSPSQYSERGVGGRESGSGDNFAPTMIPPAGNAQSANDDQADPPPSPPPRVLGGGVIDWLIFTSPNAVEFTRRRLFEIGLDSRAFGDVKIAALGHSTRGAVEEKLCRRVDLCPDNFVAEAIADALHDANQIAGNRFLLLRADIARPVLVDRLRAGGAAEVRDIAIYETHPAAALPEAFLEALRGRRVDWITFASSSSARNLAHMLGDNYRELLAGIKFASIGPATSAMLRELHLDDFVEAKPYNLDGLVDAIVRGGKKEL